MDGIAGNEACLSKKEATAVVGVGVGVCCAEEAVEIAGEGLWAVGTWPEYVCPNSPGLNDTLEQNPSEEVMSSVSPSFDLEACQPEEENRTKFNRLTK